MMNHCLFVCLFSFNVHQKFLSLSKYRVLGPAPVSDSVGLEWAEEFAFLICPRFADAAGLETIF